MMKSEVYDAKEKKSKKKGGQVPRMAQFNKNHQKINNKTHTNTNSRRPAQVTIFIHYIITSISM